MNRLIKYSKIILIVFILAILSIAYPHIASAYEEGDTTVVEQATKDIKIDGKPKEISDKEKIK